MHSRTLFHLVPRNHVAWDALAHPDNRRFVSNSSSNYGPGLEIGFHVSSLPRGHVISRLGRGGDLILCKSTPSHPMSTVHVAFELNPSTNLVLLSVRSKRSSSVSFSILPSPDKKGSGDKNPSGEARGVQITGDGVITYAQNYRVTIASYEFNLVWRTFTLDSRSNRNSLEKFTIQEYEVSMRLTSQLRTRDRPTEIDTSEAQSWHITRLNTTRPNFQDVRELRKKIGIGSFGTVYSAYDQTSGYKFAIKVVHLDRYGNTDEARALLHREIKVMERLKHKHIIEYLGYQLFDTLKPEILMPIHTGSLTSLAQSPLANLDSNSLCLAFLEQILSALDYLANENLVHRDLKPDNILYSNLSEDRYLFQLADFGLAQYYSLATTLCGTGYYQAPELRLPTLGVKVSQSHKLDIWSLYATTVAVHTRFKEFPPATLEYEVVLDVLKAKAGRSVLKPMARLHPDRRASAAQMLVLLFEGRGLTTPRSKIPPIEPDIDGVP